MIKFELFFRSCSLNILKIWMFDTNVPFKNYLYHETILPTTIVCKKIPCYMRDSGCDWRMAKNAKIFWSDVKQFWALPLVRNYRILIEQSKPDFKIVQSFLLITTMKQSYKVTFFFLLFKYKELKYWDGLKISLLQRSS